MSEANAKNPLMQLEVMLDEYFGKKAPALPQNAKEIIVKIAPYLTILSVILTLPAILLLLGLSSFVAAIAPLSGAGVIPSGPLVWLGTLLLIPSVILEVMAIPGLFARSKQAWTYMYWAQLISIVSSLVQFNIIGAVLGALIGFYLLFQIKSFYK